MPLLSQEEKLSLLFSVVFVVFSFFKMFIILFVGLRLGGMSVVHVLLMTGIMNGYRVVFNGISIFPRG